MEQTIHQKGSRTIKGMQKGTNGTENGAESSQKGTKGNQKGGKNYRNASKNVAKTIKGGYTESQTWHFLPTAVTSIAIEAASMDQHFSSTPIEATSMTIEVAAVAKTAPVWDPV